MRMSWVRVSPKPPPILSDWHWFFSIYILCTLQPAEVYGVLAQSAEQTPYKCQGCGSIPRNTTRESNPPSQRDAKLKKHYCFLYGCCYDSILVFELRQYVCGLLLVCTGCVLYRVLISWVAPIRGSRTEYRPIVTATRRRATPHIPMCEREVSLGLTQPTDLERWKKIQQILCIRV